MKFHAWIAALLLLFAFSCTDDDYPVTLEIAQAQRLLTNDSSKVWIPVMDQGSQDCAADDEHKFIRASANKLGEYSVHPGSIFCDGEGAIKGTWEVVEGESKHLLRIHISETEVYQIDFITASKLQLLDNNQEVKTFMAKP